MNGRKGRRGRADRPTVGLGEPQPAASSQESRDPATGDNDECQLRGGVERHDRSGHNDHRRKAERHDKRTRKAAISGRVDEQSPAERHDEQQALERGSRPGG